MEFLSKNKIATTTMMSISAGTATLAYFFDRNVQVGFVGVDASVSVTVLEVAFSPPVVASHVLLQNHNLKDFSIYYNGTTTNQIFASTTNSETSSYISFPSVTVSAIAIKMNDVNVAGAPKKIGELVIAERQYQAEVNPTTVNDFSPETTRTQIVHEMPDFGSKVFNVRDKYQAHAAWKYVSQTMRDALFSVFRTGAPVYFLPAPTATGWDGDAFEVQFEGNFDFKESANAAGVGYTGSIFIRQTPSA